MVDFIGGMIPALLPAFREAFILRLALGVWILTAFSFACNMVQVMIGPFRNDKRKPVFLELGLILCVTICFIALLPKQANIYPLIILLAVISGCGVAMAHPEALRVLHALKRLPSATATTIFMASGFFGFALGGGIGGFIVDKFGLPALYFVAIPPMLILIALRLFRVRMATEKPRKTVKQNDGIWFWPIFAMAFSAAVATIIITAFISEILVSSGFTLSFGGFCLMVYGICSSLGALMWAKIAGKIGELRSIIVGLLLGTPFLYI